MSRPTHGDDDAAPAAISDGEAAAWRLAASASVRTRSVSWAGPRWQPLWDSPPLQDATKPADLPDPSAWHFDATPARSGYGTQTTSQPQRSRRAFRTPHRPAGTGASTVHTIRWAGGREARQLSDTSASLLDQQAAMQSPDHWDDVMNDDHSVHVPTLWASARPRGKPISPQRSAAPMHARDPGNHGERAAVVGVQDRVAAGQRAQAERSNRLRSRSLPWGPGTYSEPQQQPSQGLGQQLGGSAEASWGVSNGSVALVEDSTASFWNSAVPAPSDAGADVRPHVTFGPVIAWERSAEAAQQRRQQQQQQQQQDVTWDAAELADSSRHQVVDDAPPLQQRGFANEACSPPAITPQPGAIAYNALTQNAARSAGPCVPDAKPSAADDAAALQTQAREPRPRQTDAAAQHAPSSLHASAATWTAVEGRAELHPGSPVHPSSHSEAVSVDARPSSSATLAGVADARGAADAGGSGAAVERNSSAAALAGMPAGPAASAQQLRYASRQSDAQLRMPASAQGSDSALPGRDTSRTGVASAVRDGGGDVEEAEAARMAAAAWAPHNSSAESARQHVTLRQGPTHLRTVDGHPQVLPQSAQRAPGDGVGDARQWVADVARLHDGPHEPRGLAHQDLLRRLERLRPRDVEARLPDVLGALEWLVAECTCERAHWRTRAVLAVGGVLCAHAALAACVDRGALAGLLQAAAADAHTYKDGRKIAQLATAQCRLTLYSREFWDALAVRPLDVLGQREVGEVVHSAAWLPAHVQCPHAAAPLWDKLLRRVREYEGALDAQSVTNCLWAVAKRSQLLDEPVGAAHRDCAAALQQRAAELCEQRVRGLSVAITCWACAKLGLPLAPALVSAAERTAHEMDTHCVSNTLYAFATAGLGAPALGVVLQAACLAAPRMNAQDVANTWWALGVQRCRPSRMQQLSLFSAARRCAPDMRPQSLAHVLGAMVRLEIADAPTAAVTALAVSLRARATELNPQDVANIVWALGKLQLVVHTQTVTALVAAIARTAPHLQPLEVRQVLCGLGRLQWRLRLPVREAVAASAVRVAGQLSGDELCSVLIALTRLEWRLGPGVAPALRVALDTSGLSGGSAATAGAAMEQVERLAAREVPLDDWRSVRRAWGRPGRGGGCEWAGSDRGCALRPKPFWDGWLDADLDAPPALIA